MTDIDMPLQEVKMEEKNNRKTTVINPESDKVSKVVLGIGSHLSSLTIKKSVKSRRSLSIRQKELLGENAEHHIEDVEMSIADESQTQTDSLANKNITQGPCLRNKKAKVSQSMADLGNTGGYISHADILQGNTMGPVHPTRHLSRTETTDVDRQNLNVKFELSRDIDHYLRGVEKQYDASNCLKNHKISAALRARMIDWKIEVLTNFKCDDQTFFISVNLMDRYMKMKGNGAQSLAVSDLHVTGVTCMFIASKFEDIYPLKMKTIHEKIAHKKLEMNSIKKLELDILKTIDYKIHAPTVLDFLKVYLHEVLNIRDESRTESKKKEQAALENMALDP